MKPTLFRKRPYRYHSVDQFVDMVYSSQMRYWASDLLRHGLQPRDIRQAVRKAMAICKTTGVDVHKHFQLMYRSSDNGVSFDDCKMTQMGYRLTVLNANPQNAYVAKIQMQLAQRN